MRAAPKRIARSVRGFTLIELMVALVLGLLMIGAVIIVFISNQQTAQTKQELDRAQEAVRFASHTIMRVVQQGVIQEPPQNSTPERFRLVVRMNPPPAPPAPSGLARSDCFGRPIVADPNLNYVDVAFILYRDPLLDRYELRCRVARELLTGTSPPPDEATLVSGLDPERTKSDFGLKAEDDEDEPGFWFDNSRWLAEADVDDDDWPYVRSVRVHLAMRTEEGSAAIGPVAVFSATMRCGALDIC